MTDPAVARGIIRRALRRPPASSAAMTDDDARASLDADLLELRAADNAAPKPIVPPVTPTR